MEASELLQVLTTRRPFGSLAAASVGEGTTSETDATAASPEASGSAPLPSAVTAFERENYSALCEAVRLRTSARNLYLQKTSNLESEHAAIKRMYLTDYEDALAALDAEPADGETDTSKDAQSNAVRNRLAKFLLAKYDVDIAGAEVLKQKRLEALRHDKSKALTREQRDLLKSGIKSRETKALEEIEHAQACINRARRFLDPENSLYV
jgi:hypothetical protein